MQRTIFNNFVAQELGVRADQLGWLESIREIPGVLTFFMILLTVLLARNILIAVSVGLVGAGLGLYAVSRDIATLIFATTVYSVGYHLFFPLQSAQVLTMAGPGQKARRLGELNSIAALAFLLSMGFVYVTSGFLGFRQLFLVAGIVTLGGAVTMLALPRVKQAERPRSFVMRRKYWLYYVLTFLSASRRQITATFAVYALVTIYGAPVKTIAALMFVSNVVALLTRSACGQWVDRIGEAKSLMIGYSGVILMFAGYAFIRVPWILYTLYVLDNFLIGFQVAEATYLDRVAEPGEVPPSLALGTTINHVTAVAVPVIAGYLWANFGHPVTFGFGIVVALISLYFVSRINSTLAYASSRAQMAAEAGSASTD